MAEEIAVPEQVQVSLLTRLAVRHVRAWTGAYLRQLVIVDVCSALAAGWLAFEARFGSADTNDSAYIWLVLALPALWLVALQLTGAYDERFIRVSSDEFRRVLNAGVCLTAVVAVCSFAAKIDPGPRVRGHRPSSHDDLRSSRPFLPPQTATPAAGPGLLHAQGGRRRVPGRHL